MNRYLGTTLAYVEARTARDNHPGLVIGGTGLERVEADRAPDALGIDDA